MTKEQAQKKASEIKKALGKGWKSRIWDNIGWHVSVERSMSYGHYVSVRYDEHMQEQYEANLMGLGVVMSARGHSPIEALARLRRAIEYKAIQWGSFANWNGWIL